LMLLQGYRVGRYASTVGLIPAHFGSRGNLDAGAYGGWKP
jgi:hypothetical protein